jgi:hypothetical protein
LPPDNNDNDKSLKDLPNRKSKGRFVTSIWVDRQTHEDFVAECRRAGYKTCDVIEIFERIFLGMRGKKLDQILDEDERSDRVERKREIFTHTLFTQTQNRDKRGEKNLLGNDGKRTSRFYCALRDVWVEFGDLPLGDCRGCPNKACRAYVFSRVA